jgi:NADPH:quinone reductase-like Zn-dependent oxidoreductase
MKIKINESQYRRLLETITDTEVICDECGWSWALADGGNDPYICHKCGHDNEEKKHIGDKVMVYDSVGKDTWDKSLNCISPFGLMASFGNASGPVDPFSPGILGPKGSIYVTRQTLFTHIASREVNQLMADDLFEVVTSGKVKIRIDQRYPLAEVAQAHRDLEARKTTGCTILTV